MAQSVAWALPAVWQQQPQRAGHRRELADNPAVDKHDPPAAASAAGWTHLDEAALVEACVAGQPGAFDVIVERHRRAVYQLCYRFVGNHEDASELAQDVFVRAYRGLHRFRRQSSLGTWLYRIGVNVCLNRVSAKRPLTEPIDARPHVDERAPDAAGELLRAERAAEVRAAIARLPNKQRATVILRDYK